MNLLYFRWLIDFGLVVMIWMVQWVVYPSFPYFQKTNLVAWHKKYTTKISYVVFPLMMTQLVLCTIMVLFERSLFTIGSLVIVLALFAVTFVIFVPLHDSISRNPIKTNTLKKLVDKNWLRTMLWTLLFVWTTVQLLFFQ